MEFQRSYKSVFVPKIKPTFLCSPQSANVIVFLKNRQIGVAETSEKRGATNGGGTTSKKSNLKNNRKVVGSKKSFFDYPGMITLW